MDKKVYYLGDPERSEEIKQALIKLGGKIQYIFSYSIENFAYYIDIDGYIDCINITDNEFINKISKEYTKATFIKKEFTYEDLKPGMILVTKTNELLVLFPTKNGLAYTCYRNSASWCHLCDECKSNFGVTTSLHSIVNVLGICNEKINDGEVLWDINGSKLTLTIDDIAEKFGVDASKINIVK